MALLKASTSKNKTWCSLIGFTSWMFLYCNFLLVVFSGSGNSQNISVGTVKYLPGYSGELPFSLETGYIGVGESEEIQLFYYFVESQLSPSLDPFVLWLTGGPGCSCVSALFYESGPLRFKYIDYNGSVPTLIDNPYTWTKTLNILYVDAPVGTGFSYSNTQEGYYSDDYNSTTATYQFLRKFLASHPQFYNNPLYIGGDSYSGKMVPMVVNLIVNDNMGGEVSPKLNIQGYVLGNPVTDYEIDNNSKIKFAYQMSLISEALYKSAKSSCHGDYYNVSSSNEKCINDLAAIGQLLRDINVMQVLEPCCNVITPEPEEARRSLVQDPAVPLIYQVPVFWCRNYTYALSEKWANLQEVQEALHVRMGTVPYWMRCNGSLAYTNDVKTVVPYHRNLSSSRTILRALIFSGDHDMSIPHIGTQKWIGSLNLTVEETWRAWFVDGQVAGYTERYISDTYYNLIFATVKGAGHIAPEYMPKQAATLIKRWFAYYPL